MASDLNIDIDNAGYGYTQNSGMLRILKLGGGDIFPKIDKSLI